MGFLWFSMFSWLFSLGFSMNVIFLCCFYDLFCEFLRFSSDFLFLFLEFLGIRWNFLRF